MTAMSSSENSEQPMLRSILETISYRIRSVSLWVWVTLQHPLSPRKLSKLLKPPKLPPENLTPQIQVAKMQRIMAESKLASTERYLGAEVDAVKRRLKDSEEEFVIQVQEALRRRGT